MPFSLIFCIKKSKAVFGMFLNIESKMILHNIILTTKRFFQAICSLNLNAK